MPNDPNLEFHRRRARELLKAAQAGDPAARARFARHHPDFVAAPSATEREGPDGHALNQAQLVIAREAGFSSWPRLKAYVSALERSRDQAPPERLQQIIRERDLDALAGFLDQYPDAVQWQIEPLGFTPSHVAVSVNWDAGVGCLLDAGADIDAANNQLGMSPLRAAVHYGCTALALGLLAGGADPRVTDSEQRTVMQAAAYAGDVTVLRALIDAGVAPDIFAAVALGDAERVRRLCADDRRILEQRMCAHQNVTITPLHLATRLDDAAMVALLIDLGADPSPTDEQGRTPIDLALHAGNRTAYRQLQARGAAANAELLAMVGDPERAERMANLHSALVDGDLAAVERALDADPSLVNQRLPDVWGTGGTFGAAPLHWAAMFGRIDVARLLLGRGASLSLRDLTYDSTPLGWATEHRRREMVAFLEAYDGR
jgi:ankyrin repeat protein